VVIQTEKPVSILTNIPQRNTVSADSCNDISLTYQNMDQLLNRSNGNVEHNTVRLTNTSNGNVKSDCELATKYRHHCCNNGFIDSEEHFWDEKKKITRKYGWKYFKVLSDADYITLVLLLNV
jgi:hypothetical protein